MAASAGSLLNHLKRPFNAQRSAPLAGRIFFEGLKELSNNAGNADGVAGAKIGSLPSYTALKVDQSSLNGDHSDSVRCAENVRMRLRRQLNGKQLSNSPATAASARNASVNRLGFMSIPFQAMDSTHFWRSYRGSAQ
jgi:hypothetical protein